jgi:hypothetical protein
MTALVSVETVLLVLLVLLVAGLLRSHAEILRRLGPPGEPDGTPQPAAGRALAAGIPQPAPGRRGADEPAAAIAGTTLEDDAVTLDFAGGAGAPTLLAFLSSGCSTCAGFWERLGERRLPDGVETVIVTHGPDRELPAKLRSIAPAGIPVVMSSDAWADYGVPGSPYFVLVHGTVRGEGAATTWKGLASLVGDAIEEQRTLARRQPLAGGPARARRIDDTFAAAGIGPDHPSLYPGRQSSDG